MVERVAVACIYYSTVPYQGPSWLKIAQRYINAPADRCIPTFRNDYYILVSRGRMEVLYLTVLSYCIQPRRS